MYHKYAKDHHNSQQNIFHLTQNQFKNSVTPEFVLHINFQNGEVYKLYNSKNSHKEKYYQKIWEFYEIFKDFQKLELVYRDGAIEKERI